MKGKGQEEPQTGENREVFRGSEPLQAEVNIGMVGHVDHGKCIALDSAILLNSELSFGESILESVSKESQQTRLSESESVFSPKNFRAFSLSPSFQPISVEANFFVQNYCGRMLEVETKRGKRITISPQHPLLVNNGLELKWVCGKDLRIGDAIASLREIPSQNFLKEFDSEWESALREKCWIVEARDAARLKEKTNNFSNFEDLNAQELNSLRIILKKSFYTLDKEAGLYPGELSVSFKKGKLTKRQEQALIAVFRNSVFEMPEGILINYKAKSQSFCTLKLKDCWSDAILKFLAFPIAEGCFTESSIRFSQENNSLLEEMKELCAELFEETPKYYPPFDYQINNKALVCFLQARYKIKIGNSRKGGIPEWLFSMPNSKTAVFLNWFFSLEANFNTKSNQIALTQANRRSIEIVSYCLKKFGIQHSIHQILKYATNSAKKERREYWQLLISGNKNLANFKKNIGVSLPVKNTALKSMLLKNTKGKHSDEMIPLDFNVLSELVGELGWKKKNYSRKTTPFKRRAWFWAFQDCRTKNSVSPKNMGFFIDACNKRIQELKKLDFADWKEIKKSIAEIGISQQQLGMRTGYSQKVIFRILSKPRIEEEARIKKELVLIAQTKIKNSERILQMISNNSPKNIEWDRIKKIKEINYRGPIIDLQIPGYHNFVAGTGAIVSHNTSLTKAITGKWTDTHSEELKRGISIRLGYADAVFYKCEKCSGSAAYSTKQECGKCGGTAKILRKISFVDAPGHETLMTTMLSGAALMNGAILVIAANEPCPQPRTAEHLIALKMSGINSIVVAQNKIDLVSREKALESFREIKKFLKEYDSENAQIIPVAAHFNANIDALVEALEKAVPSPKFESGKPLRMFVARSFDINRPGSRPEELKGGALGGSITQGFAKVGEEIEIAPGIDGKKLKTKISSLSTANYELQEAKPGGLIAIGTMLDPSLTKNDQMRGQVVGALDTLPEPVSRIKLEVHEMKRLLEEIGKIKVNETVVLTVGTASVAASAAKQLANNKFEFLLKSQVVVEPRQKVAISKLVKSAWRLAAYGVVI